MSCENCKNYVPRMEKNWWIDPYVMPHYTCNTYNEIMKTLFTTKDENLVVNYPGIFFHDELVFAWILNKFNNIKDHNKIHMFFYYKKTQIESRLSYERFMNFYKNELATSTDCLVSLDGGSIVFSSFDGAKNTVHYQDSCGGSNIHLIFDNIPRNELEKLELNPLKFGNILVIGSADRVPV